MKYCENFTVNYLFRLIIACSSAIFTGCGSVNTPVSEDKKSNEDTSDSQQQESSGLQHDQEMPLANSELDTLSPLKVIQEKYAKAIFACDFAVTIPSGTGKIQIPNIFILNLLNDPFLPTVFKDKTSFHKTNAKLYSDLTLEVSEIEIVKSLTSVTDSGAWALSFSPIVKFVVGGSYNWNIGSSSGSGVYNNGNSITVGEIASYHSSVKVAPTNTDGNMLESFEYSIACKLDLELKPQYKNHKVKL